MSTPTTPCDRWALTVAGLLGKPWPALPAIRGRLHRAAPIPDGDPYADAWDAEHQTTDPERTEP